MTIKNRRAFPPDGKAMVVGPEPEPAIQGRYHRRAHFRNEKQVKSLADIPENVAALLVCSQIQPPEEVPRLFSLVPDERAAKLTFDSQAMLSRQLGELLRCVDTRIDPDLPLPPRPEPTKPRQLSRVPTPEAKVPTNGNHNDSGELTPDDTSQDNPVDVSDLIRKHADLKGDDDYESRRVWALHGGTKTGFKVEDFKNEFRRQRREQEGAPRSQLTTAELRELTEDVPSSSSQTSRRTTPPPPPAPQPPPIPSPLACDPLPQPCHYSSVFEFALDKYNPRFSSSELANRYFDEMRAAGLDRKLGSLVVAFSNIRSGVIQDKHRAKYREVMARLASQAQHPDCVDIDTAAERLGVSRRTIYNWIKEGRLPTQREGSHQFIALKDLNRARNPSYSASGESSNQARVRPATLACKKKGIGGDALNVAMCSRLDRHAPIPKASCCRGLRGTGRPCVFIYPKQLTSRLY